ncbi:MAG: LysR family transcriptional regulator [Clostridiales bacterium]|nr:LysR family transcriptional regulator [Clostridiales bacterium]
MEIRILRYFLAVAREENMTRAAEQLHVTQPTLSKALKSLEDELGKKLFTRHSFSIQLTEEGALLRDRAEDLVSMADKIEKEFVSLDDMTGGELFLGLAESYQIKYVADAIKDLKNRYPGLHYHITSGDTEQVAEKLSKGLLDFVVLAEEPDEKKYEFVPFPEADRWGLILPADDPLAVKESFTPSDLVGLPLFCSGQAWNNEIASWAGELFSDFKLEGSFKLSYNGSIFAKAGLGYLLTFDRLIDVSPESGLVFRPLSPRLETKLYLVWKKYQTLTPIAERFLDQVRAHFEHFKP